MVVGPGRGDAFKRGANLIWQDTLARFASSAGGKAINYSSKANGVRPENVLLKEGKHPLDNMDAAAVLSVPNTGCNYAKNRKLNASMACRKSSFVIFMKEPCAKRV